MSRSSSARYDTPWCRLPWTGSLAIALWLLSCWALAAFLLRAPVIPERIPPINARFIEIKEPPPAPPALENPLRPLVQRPRKASAPTPVPVKPVAASSQTGPVFAEEPDLAAALPAQGPVEQALPVPAPRFVRHVEAGKRGRSAGIAPRAAFLSVDVEENPPDDMFAQGQGLAGWVQQGGEACEFEHIRAFDHQLWQQRCGGLPVFSLPSIPWCFDAAESFGYKGSCEEDFNRAMAAYKRQDYSTALARFKTLGGRDYAPAQFSLATMYADGVGVERDLKQAAHWYGKAAAEGNVQAIYNLALMYSDGRGVAKDDQKAAFWYRKAAYFGFAEAQYNLAVMYADGTGVKQDDKQSAYWYRKAADLGHPVAQYNLGVLHAEGVGVPRDDKLAMYWYCKALARGDERVQPSLALIYPGGAGNAGADELAYFCWLISSSKRISANSAEDVRMAHERKLTSEQRDRVREAFNVWKAMPIR